MIQTALIQNAHSDLVTDACYDMYGLYLATCGLDQRIKVWSLDESSGQWNVADDWKAHDAALTKVSWAHPSFGSIIASSSFDRTVKIWEKMPASAERDLQANGSSSTGSGRERWAERAVLVDAKGSVRAVEFAPHHFGLKLAAISSDNYLRVYECLETPQLSSWDISDEVDVSSLPTRSPLPSSSLAQSLAMSTPTPAATQSATVGAALDGASVSSRLQAAAREQQQAQQNAPAARPGAGAREADGGWCVSWCKERYWGEIVAVGAGVSGVIKLIQFSPHRRPLTLLALAPEPAPATMSSSSTYPTSTGGRGAMRSGIGAPYAAAASGGSGGEETTFAVTSVAWAPSCGRSFHLIATGSRDGHVRIWKVRPPPPSSLPDEQDASMDASTAEEKWSASLVAEFDDHKLSVTRVEWNITGTVLSSAGNDGRVRLWKQTVGGVWRTAGYISVEQTEEQETPASADVEMDEDAIAD